MSAPRFGYARWEDFLFKAQLIEADGKKAVTTFNNTVGYGQFKIDDKVYTRVVTTEYKELEDGE